MPFVLDRPMIQQLLEKLLNWHTPKSGDEAKRRLKLVIAHDRVGLNAERLDRMREEILELSSDDRMTALVANLPIRRIKQGSLPE